MKNIVNLSNFAEVLDACAHETERTPVQPSIPLDTNIEEVRKFMGMGNKSLKMKLVCGMK